MKRVITYLLSRRPCGVRCGGLAAGELVGCLQDVGGSAWSAHVPAQQRPLFPLVTEHTDTAGAEHEQASAPGPQAEPGGGQAAQQMAVGEQGCLLYTSPSPRDS